MMLWSFAIGLCIDIFSNTPGMNAAAAVLLAFCRPLLLRSQLLRGSTDLFEPGIRVMGFLPFLRYAFAGVLVHVTALDMLDVFSWAHFDVLILKIVSDVAVTLMGFLPFLRYAFAGVLVHVTALDMLDVFSWAHFDVLILKIVSDVAVTLFCILCVDAVRRKK